MADWLAELGATLQASGNMTLIGSAALLWQAQDRGLASELPEASMDVDPVTDSEEVAMRCYEALIGSEFERIHGWHVNLMPKPSCGNCRLVGNCAPSADKSANCNLSSHLRPICLRPSCGATSPVTGRTPSGPAGSACSTEWPWL